MAHVHSQEEGTGYTQVNRQVWTRGARGEREKGSLQIQQWRSSAIAMTIQPSDQKEFLTKKKEASFPRSSLLWVSNKLGFRSSGKYF